MACCSQPLPYGSADRLVSVSADLRAPELQTHLAAAGAYFTYKRFARRIEDIGFYRSGSANIAGDGRSNEAERVTATWVTASTIPMLQVSPLIGRSFTTERGQGPRAERRRSSARRCGERAFSRAATSLGKRSSSTAFLARSLASCRSGFDFRRPRHALWLPARIDPSATTAGDFTYASVARLSPRVTADEAQRELASVLPRMAESFPRLESGLATAAWLDAGETDAPRRPAARRDH